MPPKTNMTDSMFGPNSDHAVALAAAHAGGIVAKSFFRSDFGVREKKPGDPVTEADEAARAKEAEVAQLSLEVAALRSDNTRATTSEARIRVHPSPSNSAELHPAPA